MLQTLNIHPNTLILMKSMLFLLFIVGCVILYPLSSAQEWGPEEETIDWKDVTIACYNCNEADELKKMLEPLISGKIDVIVCSPGGYFPDHYEEKKNHP